MRVTREPSRAPRTPIAQDDPLWAAVVARNKDADGSFCYSVKSTGVYCRPSCSARLPKRSNVAFHASCAAAEAAGVSRRYGGIHFSQGDLKGRALGVEVGIAVIKRVWSLYNWRTIPNLKN